MPLLSPSDIFRLFREGRHALGDIDEVGRRTAEQANAATALRRNDARHTAREPLFR